MNVSWSITGCMLCVMAPNVAAPAIMSSRKEIPEINITRLLFGVSVHCILGGFLRSDSYGAGLVTD